MFSLGKLHISITAFTLALLTVSCSTNVSVSPSVEDLVARKLMIDVRYYCQQMPADDKPCQQPVTQLPDDLAGLITDTGVGGIILFANNLQSTEQIVSLNHDLQQAAKKGGHAPLFIAVDQEGGRVVRLPQGVGTPFTGNMSIGATYQTFGDKFARETGKVIGSDLQQLGFNVNFAPTVDVNVNPANPVINVRSFGEDPQMVAELGLAQVTAMQQQGVMAALKHFPGHGDTAVDSHTGLPRVNHDRKRIDEVELQPFRHAIEQGDPAMIMTAHIQFPQLDSSTFIAKDGSETELPATMSRKILTDLLREEMGFKGLIITDALDMAGIAHYFDHTQAVIQTFKAGTDIALMPIAIRSPEDIPRLKSLISEVSAAVVNGEISLEEVQQSAQRIADAKQRFNVSYGEAVDGQKLAGIKAALDRPEHKQLQQTLADNAIVSIRNNGLFPLAENVQRINLVMPDRSKCDALSRPLQQNRPGLQISCVSMASLDVEAAKGKIAASELNIFADITPRQSLAEMGGMDDMQAWRNRDTKIHPARQLMQLMKVAKNQGRQVLFISLRAPYNVPQFAPYADAILASFAYSAKALGEGENSGYSGPAYKALANVITGAKPANGTLPVTISW